MLEETTLNPYSLNMKLDYGPISIYNDDRTIAESARFTYTGWYFKPILEGYTTSLQKDDQIVMYVQI